jgi:phosphoribosylanthranilate isomerase
MDVDFLNFLLTPNKPSIPKSNSLVKIKICGLTRLEDIDAVNAAEPDYIGFVYNRRSRRKFVDLEKAKKFMTRLSKDIIPVGIFANAHFEDILHLALNNTLKVVQLQGNEDAAYIRELRDWLASLEINIIKAVSIDDFPNDLKPDYFLIESKGSSAKKTSDWNKLRTLRDSGAINAPFFIGGDINEKNIKEALAIEPYGIDISSGAETDGLKDAGKIARLTEEVRLKKHAEETK